MRGQKWSTWDHFLIPNLETPKYIATKRGKDLSGTWFYHSAKFHADRCHRRRDICNRTQQKTANDIPFHTPYGA